VVEYEDVISCSDLVAETVKWKALRGDFTNIEAEGERCGHFPVFSLR
jgi:hypothetical protein